ncbi:MAG: YfiR family protein [Bacteroidota bacterium]
MKKLLLIFIVLFVAGSGIRAQSEITEAKVKFLYNFTKFFEWSKSEQSGDFIIGVLGSEDIYQELEDFTKDKKVIVKDIQVKRFQAASDVTDCHILFVSGVHSRKLPDLNERLGSNTLLVSDSENGIEQGAALNFILKDDRLKYEFAASHAKNKGLKFSSQIKDMAAKNY